MLSPNNVGFALASNIYIFLLLINHKIDVVPTNNMRARTFGRGTVRRGTVRRKKKC